MPIWQARRIHAENSSTLVKEMVREIADQTMGGMHNIVKAGDKVLIKINTVIPVAANAGFTTDPRMLEALIELVKEQSPARIQIGERCAMGADTMQAMDVCGIAEVAQRTGRNSVPSNMCRSTCTRSTARSALTNFPFHVQSARRTSISACRR